MTSSLHNDIFIPLLKLLNILVQEYSKSCGHLSNGACQHTKFHSKLWSPFSGAPIPYRRWKSRPELVIILTKLRGFDYIQKEKL